MKHVRDDPYTKFLRRWILPVMSRRRCDVQLVDSWDAMFSCLVVHGLAQAEDFKDVPVW